MRLYVVVEGQTEQEFVEDTLAPWLYRRAPQLAVEVRVVETSRDAAGRKRRGGGRWANWHRDLRNLCRSQPGPGVRFTTMFDLYGLPSDFPQLAELSGVTDTASRVARLEAAMAEALEDDRLIPYIQRHEFEALVLASLDALVGLLDEQALAGVPALRELCARVAPEDVNDGRATCPSRRLETLVRGYRKTVHGVLAVQARGIEGIRGACPRFDGWVARLESLGGPTT